jgi:hypothetical protein
MLDVYTYLSGEIRHLAFRKSSEQASWQDAIKQQRVTDMENRLGKLIKSNFLRDFSKTLLFQFRPWRRKHHQASALMANLPSHHKAG